MKRTLAFLVFTFVSVSIARPAPTFRGELISGERVSMKELLQPKKSLLLCFWATWCVPCMEELRMVEKKLKADPSLPVTVVTVNVDSSETSSDIPATIAQQKLRFPVILDPKHEIFSRFHQGKSLPFSVLIDSQGDIASTFEGLNENMFAEIQSKLGKAAPYAE